MHGIPSNYISHSGIGINISNDRKQLESAAALSHGTAATAAAKMSPQQQHPSAQRQQRIRCHSSTVASQKQP